MVVEHPVKKATDRTSAAGPRVGSARSAFDWILGINVASIWIRRSSWVDLALPLRANAMREGGEKRGALT